MTFHSPIHTNETVGIPGARSAFMKLGTVIENPVTPSQAQKLAFDWEVETQKLYTSTFTDVPNHVAKTRSDTGDVIGVTGKDFGTITNADFVALCEATGLGVPLVGTINLGGRVWMMLEAGDSKILDDPHKRFVYAENGHDGSGSMKFRPMLRRIACMNELSSIIKVKNIPGEVTLRHTKHVNNRLEAARMILAKTFDAFTSMDRDIERLLARNISSDDMYATVKKVIGPRPFDKVDEDGRIKNARTISNYDDRFAAIVGLYNGDTVANIRGTAYGAVMAVNEYELNRGTVKADTSAKRVLSGLPMTVKAAAVFN